METIFQSCLSTYSAKGKGVEGDNRGFAKVSPSRCTSLDINLQNSPKLGAWSKKQKRAFHRLFSGIRRAEALGTRVRFMTLTSSPQSSWVDLNRHFEIFVKRIRRRFGIKIEYWKIKTNEGNGVLHVVFKGGYLPQRWVSRMWMEIHGAGIVDIRQFRFGSRALARYLIGVYYCAKQSFERMSWSWRWVQKGFVWKWKILILKFGFERAIRMWNWLLTQPIMFWSDAKITSWQFL